MIFSSHILSEVQALCDRVVIINKGKMVLNERASDLHLSGSQTKTLIVEFDQPILVTDLEGITGVIDVKSLDSGRYQLRVEADKDIRPLVFRFASEKDKTLVELREQ